jgi:hypothetical protein
MLISNEIYTQLTSKVLLYLPNSLNRIKELNKYRYIKVPSRRSIVSKKEKKERIKCHKFIEAN